MSAVVLKNFCDSEVVLVESLSVAGLTDGSEAVVVDSEATIVEPVVVN